MFLGARIPYNKHTYPPIRECVLFLFFFLSLLVLLTLCLVSRYAPAARPLNLSRKNTTLPKAYWNYAQVLLRAMLREHRRIFFVVFFRVYVCAELFRRKRLPLDVSAMIHYRVCGRVAGCGELPSSLGTRSSTSGGRRDSASTLWGKN